MAAYCSSISFNLMIAGFAVAIAFGGIAIAKADDTSAFAQLAIQQRAKELERAESELKSASREHQPHWRAQVNRLRTAICVRPKLFCNDKLQAGEVGYLVVHAPGKESLEFLGGIAPSGEDCDVDVPLEVVQIIDDDNAIVRFESAVFWMRIAREKVYADTFILPGPVKVVGVRSYDSSLGPITVKELALHSVGDWETKAAQLSKIEDRGVPKPRTINPPAWEADHRVWRDRTGKFSVEAVYHGAIEHSVRLKRKDGSELSVPLEKLSDEDRSEAIRAAKRWPGLNK
jgi:hypothetical protein